MTRRTDIKIIKPVETQGAVKLTAPQLNDIRFSSNHTPITPRKLEEEAGAQTAPGQ